MLLFCLLYPSKIPASKGQKNSAFLSFGYVGVGKKFKQFWVFFIFHLFFGGGGEQIFVLMKCVVFSFILLCRLLAIFCVVNLLNYVDRGAIASNGVNGSRGTCTEGGTCSSGSGIQ